MSYRKDGVITADQVMATLILNFPGLVDGVTPVNGADLAETATFLMQQYLATAEVKT